MFILSEIFPDSINMAALHTIFYSKTYFWWVRKVRQVLTYQFPSRQVFKPGAETWGLSFQKKENRTDSIQRPPIWGDLAMGRGFVADVPHWCLWRDLFLTGKNREFIVFSRDS